ncbi:MAG: hypothetical protein AAF670_11965 [Planctomycetota bacterium]
MTSWIELHFVGQVQRDALQRALHATIHRHPLLASRAMWIEGNWFWSYDPDFTPRLRDPESEPMLVNMPGTKAPTPRPLDPTLEPGCRYWYASDPANDTSRLIIQLHHACCDGVGLRQVLIDALTGYAARASDPNDSNPPSQDHRRRRQRDRLDPMRLRDRADFSAITEKPAKARLTWWRKLRNAHYFYLQPPDSLQGRDRAPCDTTAEATSCSESGEPIRHHLFDASTSNAILECCRRSEVSVNDLALALLFSACRQWNQSTGNDSPNRRLRLLMPIDLRGRADIGLPATNRLSFAFLGRTHGQCESWSSLLESVQEETQWIKDTRVYMDFLDGMAVATKHPRVMKALLRRGNRMCTSVLTYTGDISRGLKRIFPEENGRRRVGDVDLERILVAPPARRNTNITFGLCINWGQICLSANWNRLAMSEADCVEFLAIYAEAWRAWLNRTQATTS